MGYIALVAGIVLLVYLLQYVFSLVANKGIDAVQNGLIRKKNAQKSVEPENLKDIYSREESSDAQSSNLEPGSEECENIN